jgi:RNA polymerase sigma factor (sigma-70 family)
VKRAYLQKKFPQASETTKKLPIPLAESSFYLFFKIMKNYYIEIKKVQDKECENSLSSLIDRYSPVFLSMYSKFVSSIKQSGANPSDILDDKDMIIYESIKSFNKEKKVSFCTWLSNITKYKCLHLMNKSRKTCALKERYKNRFLSDDNKVASNPLDGRILRQELNRALKSIKDKRVAQVYCLRYFSGKKMTWSEIGKKMGFSSQTAINLHKRGADLLRVKIKA